MNHEKIIVELLGRIQTLEEQVEMLLNERNAEVKKESVKVSTDDIRQYISRRKSEAKAGGAEFIVLKSGDIHRELNLKSSLPMVCNAMRQSMEDGDSFIHTTPSGSSSTIEIRYNL